MVGVLNIGLGTILVSTDYSSLLRWNGVPYWLGGVVSLLYFIIVYHVIMFSMQTHDFTWSYNHSKQNQETYK